ncbi:MAG: alkB [Schlesneria sp.]|nr:alkB [Schlesneria sp.]
MTRREDRTSSELFDKFSYSSPCKEVIGPEAVLLRDFASAAASELMAAIATVTEVSPFRHMVTRRGFQMSVAMSNCGSVGWVSDRTGYKYAELDPLTGNSWPAMPESFRTLAEDAAEHAGFSSFAPDCCLINRYSPGAKLSLHQDRDEASFDWPIVSVSLGLSAVFLLGGLDRNDPLRRTELLSGDVVVWGGVSRLAFHGIESLEDGTHRFTGNCRINLTFRRAR